MCLKLLTKHTSPKRMITFKQEAFFATIPVMPGSADVVKALTERL